MSQSSPSISSLSVLWLIVFYEIVVGETLKMLSFGVCGFVNRPAVGKVRANKLCRLHVLLPSGAIVAAAALERP